MSIVSLLYHDVVDPGDFAASGFSGADADIYKFERPQFESHIRALRQALPPGAITVLSGSGEPPSRAVLLTFDDGGSSACTATAGLLESAGWRGHFFVSTDYIGRRGFLTPPQIRELAARGHVIGSHSCSHPPRMSACPSNQLHREWTDSVAALADILGAPVLTASVPGGYYSGRVGQAAAEAGIRLLFTSEPTTRLGRAGACRILGRYSIQQGVSPQTAAAIARGELPPRLRQFLYWNCKKLLKRLGGSYWTGFRKSWLAWKAGR